MQLNNIKDVDGDLTILFKVVDKLEQRISKLEKVLESHAKCIGEMREEKNDQYIIFSWNLCNWNFSLFRNERNRGNMSRTETIMIIGFVIYLFAMFWIGGIR